MTETESISDAAFFKLCWGQGDSRKTFLGRKYHVILGRESRLQEVDVKLSTWTSFFFCERVLADGERENLRRFADQDVIAYESMQTIPHSSRGSTRRFSTISRRKDGT